MRFVLCKPNRVSISSPLECVILSNTLLKKKEISTCFHIHVCWHLVTISCYLLNRDFRTVTCLENIRLTIIWEYPDTCHSAGVYIYPYIIVACLAIVCKHTTSFTLTKYLLWQRTLFSSFHKGMRTWAVTQQLKSRLVRSIAVINQDSSRVFWADSQSICLVTQTSANQKAQIHSYITNCA